MAWRFLIIAAITLAVGTTADAQARLSGVVRDTTGAPLSGVEVSVQGVTRTATTDRNGAFQISGIPAGTSVVNMRRVGYAPQSTIVRFTNGETTALPDVVLTALPRELDTVRTREQELFRERPLLREFEENRRVGLGQFVTREQLARQQGGFISPLLNQMRGLLVVRSRRFANMTWLANRYIPHVSPTCTELEDNTDGSGGILPAGADCNFCFPAVYLDYTRISGGRTAANVSQFSPDQLQGIEIYLGAAETPIRYSGGASGCGVIVFHTRAADSKPRIIANRQDVPTRSRLFVNASLSAAKSGQSCENCDPGPAKDFTVGYTLRDRWVISGRYADWKGSNPAGPQSIELRQLLVEWYPHPEPARVKWFVNAGGGTMGVDINVSHMPDYTDRFTAGALPSFAVGTGVDLTVFRRFVVTPFLSHSRSMSGSVVQQRCVPSTPPTAGPFTDCFSIPGQPRSFSLSQLGTRFGWR